MTTKFDVRQAQLAILEHPAKCGCRIGDMCPELLRLYQVRNQLALAWEKS